MSNPGSSTARSPGLSPGSSPGSVYRHPHRNPLQVFFGKRTNKIQDSNIQPLKTLKPFELARPVGKQFSNLCISQFRLRSAPTPPQPRADSRALAFFLPWMANSRGWGLLSCQIFRGGDEKK